MTKADTIFKENIERILKDGVFSEQARPKYKGGTVANSKYVTGAFAGMTWPGGNSPSLPCVLSNPPSRKYSGFYQDQSNSLDVLMISTMFTTGMMGKWGDTGTIGERYGAVVKKHDIINKILKQLEANPWNRHIILSGITKHLRRQTASFMRLFRPCLMSRRVDGEIYLDATLTQRSNDMLLPHHINAMQYVALQMMIAKHFGWKVGKFFYFINNLHIYDNQFEQAEELLRREPSMLNHAWF